MSAVYNPESEIIARIEGLEVEGRLLRRRIERAGNEEDARILRRQLAELKENSHIIKPESIDYRRWPTLATCDDLTRPSCQLSRPKPPPWDPPP